jgi:hypothetical protein
MFAQALSDEPAPNNAEFWDRFRAWQRARKPKCAEFWSAIDRAGVLFFGVVRRALVPKIAIIGRE